MTNTFKSHSQACQDRFVHDLLGDIAGTFIDIGCGDPVDINNTKALEDIGWRGLLIDAGDVAEACRTHRKSPFVQGDATKLNYEQMLIAFRLPTLIDYLSLDVDAATLDTLKQIPLDQIRFRVITIEHDSYRFGAGPRDEMRAMLSKAGYTMICQDVSNPDPFEDWWVDMSKVDNELAECVRCVGSQAKDITIRPIIHPDFENYFDKIFCINLDRRPDRWRHAKEQMDLYGLKKVERFSGHDQVRINGTVNGNAGCTNSHRALLEIIAYHKWDKVLVLEDDFQIRDRRFHQLFKDMIGEVPGDWDMLYLGGHYANAPQYRHSPHVIKFARMKTTSSYAIRWKFARQMAPYICGNSAIDELYSGFTPFGNCYIFTPRLMVQYPSYSDLTERESGNAMCMEDCEHEKMV